MNKLDEAFSELEKEFDESRPIRGQMIQLLQSQLDKCKIGDCDKPMMITAKMDVIKTLNSLLQSNEDLSLKKVKMQLARREGESNGMIGDAVVELLKLARADRKDVKKDDAPHVEDLKKADQELSQKAAELDLHIAEGEMEAC